MKPTELARQVASSVSVRVRNIDISYADQSLVSFIDPGNEIQQSGFAGA